MILKVYHSEIRPVFVRIAVRLALVSLIIFAAGLSSFLTVGERPPTVPSAVADTSQQARIVPVFVSMPIPGPLVGLSATYVSFQTETTPDHDVVQTVGGSSEVSDNELASGSLRETSNRRAMVDKLRTKMQDAGWTESGVDGQWFEYVFER